jgi:hypothetical protein
VVTDFLRTSPDAARFVRRVSGAAVGSVDGARGCLQQPEQQAQQQSEPAPAVPAPEQGHAAALQQQQKQQQRKEHLLPPAQELRFTPSPPAQQRQQLQQRPFGFAAAAAAARRAASVLAADVTCLCSRSRLQRKAATGSAGVWQRVRAHLQLRRVNTCFLRLLTAHPHVPCYIHYSVSSTKRLMDVCRSAGDWEDTQHSGSPSTPSPVPIAAPQRSSPGQVGRCAVTSPCLLEPVLCRKRRQALHCPIECKRWTPSSGVPWCIDLQRLDPSLRDPMLPAGVASGRRGRRRRRRGSVVA